MQSRADLLAEDAGSCGGIGSGFNCVSKAKSKLIILLEKSGPHGQSEGSARKRPDFESEAKGDVGHRQDQIRRRPRRARRDSGRAAARREYRHGRARHGQFRADAGLRIVNPRDGWPNVAAQRAAAGADHILERSNCSTRVEQAVADLTLLFATTARAHDQAKPVVAPEAAAREIVAAYRRRRRGRHPVRPRALRAAERGGRARQPHHHLSGQSRLCLAQPGAGGAADGL